MSSTDLGGMAEKHFTHASDAFSQPENDSSSRSLRSRRRPSIKKPEVVYQNVEDYPSAVDEDDLDDSIEVLPIRTIIYSPRLPSSEDSFDCLNIFDDETNFDRCHGAASCDPKENATQYFINVEDLFGRLNSESHYFNQHEEDHGLGREDIEGELSEEDMFFESGWDSDETVTDAQFLLDIYRERFYTEAEEIANIALRDIVPARDCAKYFDAADLFEREEEEMLVYGRYD